MIDDPILLTGIVLTGAHGIYDVHTDNGIFRCTLRGKLKKAFARVQTQNVVGGRKLNVYQMRRAEREREKQHKPAPEAENPIQSRLSAGDYVKFRKLDEHTGLIEEILPRQSELSRLDAGSTDKKAIPQTLLANLDQVFIVLAVAQPDPHFAFLDRYLVICEAANLSAIICLNKADLPHDSHVEEAASLYARLGYTVVWTSAYSGQGIEGLKALLKDHTSLFTGPSGVGKSSLVNALEPNMALRTGLISDATGKGRHTTTGSQLYPLSTGGWLADSAGIRALAAWDVSMEDLPRCFVEFRPYLGECVYDDCNHIDEEGCAIIQAVEDEIIDEGRYRSYVRIYTGEER
ncbi:ribosome small subunit-dependent GTPase A [Ktedonospora formicarum]|uniref:Small ribosomal subunit biogenesis GTPase RsgA n=1 Tax=Ktedonospora formicarum TaxID=2778364 RepID=A0A8J3I3Q8_9CHLR|nr:ribosome small subunit-dependent GTPase A [Ktedonospora formicarum]GHO44304.1 putative ribosome biogenesis GTPase RsgA [Ktedonospora formicarum]